MNALDVITQRIELLDVDRSFGVRGRPRTYDHVKVKGYPNPGARIQQGIVRDKPKVRDMSPLRSTKISAQELASWLHEPQRVYCVVVGTDQGFVIVNTSVDRGECDCVAITLRSIASGENQRPNRWRRVYDALDTQHFAVDVVSMGKALGMGARVQ